MARKILAAADPHSIQERCPDVPGDRAGRGVERPQTTDGQGLSLWLSQAVQLHSLP
jgi:hypothetical protein